MLRVKLKAKVTPAGIAAQITNECCFIVDEINGSEMEWADANPIGQPTANGDFLEATVCFTNLPLNNSDFGKKITAIYYGGGRQDDAEYEVFFPKTAMNHPGEGSGTIPNWFFYWRDGNVCGIDDKCDYGGDVGGMLGSTSPMVNDRITLYDQAAENNNGPFTWTHKYNPAVKVTGTGNGKGIKCVAEIIQHERHHIELYAAKQAALQADPANSIPIDGDSDGVPATKVGVDANGFNIWEEILDEVNSLYMDPNTYQLPAFYHFIGDNELRCRKIELNLTIPIYSELDWANPGCQSTNPFGP